VAKFIPQPGKVELAILRALWEHGPATVRQVHEAMGRQHATGYTSTLKMMQVMFTKGLLRRDESVRPQLYSAAFGEGQIQSHLMDEFIQRAFGGSAQKLVMRAIQSETLTRQDLAEIRKLIKQIEGGKP
jgi:BlaI family penicillinase repressor